MLTFRGMEIALAIATGVSAASALAWVWLLLGRGFFWRTDQRMAADPGGAGEDSACPPVSVVVPARNEADMLPHTLPALLKQEYRGDFHIFLVDDQSSDGTGEVARKVAQEVGAAHRLTVIAGRPLEPGWTGKLWALQQGVYASEAAAPEFLLFTDADIAHPPDSLQSLVGKAQTESLDLVSVMAHLRIATFWDRLLIPAFVFFFAKLYPFRWANDPRKPTAAAAGGCLLVRREALERAG